MRTRRLIIILVAILLVAAIYVPQQTIVGAQDSQSPVRNSIVLGDIDENPVKTIKKLQPLADYLAVHLRDYGIETGEVVVAPDMETMIEWLIAGEVDILFDSPYPSMVMAHESGAVPVLRRWKDGVAEYHSVFFTLDDSGLETLEDLQGHIMAFDAPQSTSGYMLPKWYLLQQGLDPVEKAKLSSRVAADEIGYVFSEDDETTIQWIISGRVIAGVVDSEEFASVPEETREHFVVLAETDNVPRHLMMVRPGIDEALLEAITTTLVAMDEDEAAQSILEGLNTSQFDWFPEGADAALAELQAMFDLVYE